MYLRSCLHFTFANMALAEGHLSKTKSQVSDIRTIGPLVAYAKTKAQIRYALTAQLISAFVFTTWIEKLLFFLNPKFQASGHFL